MAAEGREGSRRAKQADGRRIFARNGPFFNEGAVSNISLCTAVVFRTAKERRFTERKATIRAAMAKTASAAEPGRFSAACYPREMSIRLANLRMHVEEPEAALPFRIAKVLGVPRDE